MRRPSTTDGDAARGNPPTPPPSNPDRQTMETARGSGGRPRSPSPKCTQTRASWHGGGGRAPASARGARLMLAEPRRRLTCPSASPWACAWHRRRARARVRLRARLGGGRRLRRPSWCASWSSLPAPCASACASPAPCASSCALRASSRRRGRRRRDAVDDLLCVAGAVPDRDGVGDGVADLDIDMGDREPGRRLGRRHRVRLRCGRARGRRRQRRRRRGRRRQRRRRRAGAGGRRRGGGGCRTARRTASWSSTASSLARPCPCPSAAPCPTGVNAGGVPDGVRGRRGQDTVGVGALEPGRGHRGRARQRRGPRRRRRVRGRRRARRRARGRRTTTTGGDERRRSTDAACPPRPLPSWSCVAHGHAAAHAVDHAHGGGDAWADGGGHGVHVPAPTRPRRRSVQSTAPGTRGTPPAEGTPIGHGAADGHGHGHTTTTPSRLQLAVLLAVQPHHRRVNTLPAPARRRRRCRRRPRRRRRCRRRPLSPAAESLSMTPSKRRAGSRSPICDVQVCDAVAHAVAVGHRGRDAEGVVDRVPPTPSAAPRRCPQRTRGRARRR